MPRSPLKWAVETSMVWVPVFKSVEGVLKSVAWRGSVWVDPGCSSVLGHRGISADVTRFMGACPSPQCLSWGVVRKASLSPLGCGRRLLCLGQNIKVVEWCMQRCFAQRNLSLRGISSQRNIHSKTCIAARPVRIRKFVSQRNVHTEMFLLTVPQCRGNVKETVIEGQSSPVPFHGRMLTSGKGKLNMLGYPTCVFAIRGLQVCTGVRSCSVT